LLFKFSTCISTYWYSYWRTNNYKIKRHDYEYY